MLKRSNKTPLLLLFAAHTLHITHPDASHASPNVSWSTSRRLTHISGSLTDSRHHNEFSCEGKIHLNSALVTRFNHVHDITPSAPSQAHTELQHTIQLCFISSVENGLIWCTGCVNLMQINSPAAERNEGLLVSESQLKIKLACRICNTCQKNCRRTAHSSSDWRYYFMQSLRLIDLILDAHKLKWSMNG